ncbi:MAG: hypothetical protein AAB525_03785, partial [Patescibacteria group bacterium]
MTNDKVAAVLREIEKLPDVKIALVTGKSVSYAENILKENKLQGIIIAENGGIYKKDLNSELQIFGPSETIEAVKKLRDLLCLQKNQEGLTVIKFLKSNDQVAAVVVEPEKSEGVLTLFTEASLNITNEDRLAETSLNHEKLQTLGKRFARFKSNTNQAEIIEYLNQQIKENHLENCLTILAHNDGAIDVIRKNPQNGESIDKAKLPEIIRTILIPDKAKDSDSETNEIYKIRIAMGGDGKNDIPAFLPEVYAITAQGCDQDVINAVKRKRKRGFVSPSGMPEEDGLLEGIYWLTLESDFFSETSKEFL